MSSAAASPGLSAVQHRQHRGIARLLCLFPVRDGLLCRGGLRLLVRAAPRRARVDGKVKRGINFEMLKQMLSPDVVDGSECYEFTWVGKRASIVEANKPIRKTLRPCPEESKDWDATENLYIEGDNLEVLKLLQEAYLGKVKMIYIDPPYNTGNDFIYADDFMRSQEEENEQMQPPVQKHRHQRAVSLRLVQHDVFPADAGEEFTFR